MLISDGKTKTAQTAQTQPCALKRKEKTTKDKTEIEPVNPR